MVAKRQHFSVPEEITQQIIGRVVCIKSIISFTSVCKSWYGLIKSREFINFHLSLITDNNKNLLCEYHKCGHPTSLLTLKYDCLQSPRQLQTLFGSYLIPCYEATVDPVDDIEELIHSGGPSFAIHHHSGFSFYDYCRQFIQFPDKLSQVHVCNGVICYNTCDNPAQLYLLNPAIRILKILPTPIPDLNNYYVDDNVRSVFMLWFDSKAKDYKILRICYTTEMCTVEFYSLVTNLWKSISDNAPVTTSFLSNTRLAYVNGKFYWPVLRNGNWMLVSLDMENGIFQETLTEWHVDSRILLAPSADDCSLVIIILTCGDYQNKSLIQFYTTDAKGIIYRIPHHKMIGLKNSDEFLLESIKKGNLSIVSYSVENEIFKEFDPRMRYGIPFFETLALLDEEDASRI